MIMASYWRNSYLKPRFVGLDARLFALFVLVLIHLREWTLILVTVTVFVFMVIEIWRKVTIEVAIYSLRSMIAGRHRPAFPGQDTRVAPDYGAVERFIFADPNPGGIRIEKSGS